jgi:radical SAM superfamily enzyme YgiQ (UPF0313 family)
MRILFTQSYFFRFDPKEWKAMMPYTPLGTLYAAANVRRHGYDVDLFDPTFAHNESDIVPWFERFRPDALVVYDDDFNFLTKMCLARMRKAACTMIRLARDRGIPCIVHGSDATDNPRAYFDAGARYVLMGEADRTLVDLLNSLSNDMNPAPSTIPGVATRTGDGHVETGPVRQVERDLDSLPLPARDLVDIEPYRQAWKERHGRFSVNMVTTRGCPFHCNWCAKPLYGQVYHSHSPERIADEIEGVVSLWNPDHLWFCDDIFGLKPGWIEQFADALDRRSIRVPFKCLSRADLLLRGDTVEHLRRAGCETVWMGAESGAQPVLDAMEKGTTVEQIRKATTLLKEAGIRVGFFLQYGYPGEKKKEIRQTLQLVRDCLPEEIGISVSYPLPGTPFYNRVLKELGVKRNWDDSGDLAMLFRGAYQTRFYRALSRYTHKDHRIRMALASLTSGGGTVSLSRPERTRRLSLLPYYMVSRMINRALLALYGRERQRAEAT